MRCDPGRSWRVGLAIPSLLLGVVTAYAAAPVGPPYLVGFELAVARSGYDRLSDLAVDAAGNAYVSGVVGSHDFPGIDSAAYTNGGVDLRFVARFAPNGRTPSFTAVVGSPTKALGEDRSRDEFLRDELRGMALDGAGNAFLPAYDAQTDYVATGGQYRTSVGAKYVFKVSPAGQVTRHSSALDPAILRVAAVAVDASGAIYITGSATNGLHTTAGVPYPVSSVGTNCIAPFAMKLAASGQSVVYATYLASTAAQCTPPGTQYIDPSGLAIAVDSVSNAFITGQAEPELVASPGALDLGTKTRAFFYLGGSLGVYTASHAFVAKLGSTGSLVYAARLGGSLRDRGTSVVVDSAGNAIVAGKTSSRDFPLAGTASSSYPLVLRDCLTFNPEVGFLSKLSSSGSQLLFSTYVPLDGGQLDDCAAGHAGTLVWEPARVALDTNGNMAVAGFTSANNRDLPSTSGAIIPKPADISRGVGNQLLQIFAADGSRLLYSTPLGMYGVRGIAFDVRQVLTIASGGHLQRLVSGSLPVELRITPDPACAGQPTVITATVAGGFDTGNVDFTSDGVSLGTAAMSGGAASLAVSFASAGLRMLRAAYRGAGPFDGQSSLAFHAEVNQAGACQ